MGPDKWSIFYNWKPLKMPLKAKTKNNNNNKDAMWVLQCSLPLWWHFLGSHICQQVICWKKNMFDIENLQLIKYKTFSPLNKLIFKDTSWENFFIHTLKILENAMIEPNKNKTTQQQKSNVHCAMYLTLYRKEFWKALFLDSSHIFSHKR